jgi:hypothetical protein
MDSLYSTTDIIELENRVLASNPTITKTAFFYNEEVAQVLYNEWYKDNQNLDILIYSFPLIKNIILKKLPLIRSYDLDKQDIFQSLCVVLIEHLPKYDKNRGRIYSFFTFLLGMRILDIINSDDKTRGLSTQLIDTAHDKTLDIDRSAHDLYDFKQFLLNLKAEQASPTLSVFIDALLTLLDDSSNYCSQDHKALLLNLERITGYPRILCESLLNNITLRYRNGILD